MIVLAYTIIYAMVFLIGICIGSFSNVVIYRVPLGLNVAKGRSFCPTCGHNLKAIDLVPVISWLCLKRRCRYCGEKISGRYPVVEIIGGLLAMVAVLRYWFSPEALLTYAAAIILMIIAYVDMDHMEIPDVFNIILMGIGIVSIFITDETIVARIIGFFAVSVFMVIVNLIVADSFGGGDIKLCAAMGFFLGWKSLLVGTFIGILLGGIYGAILLINKKKGKKEHFAFGPFLAVGFTAALFAGDVIWSHYIGLFLI